MHEHQHGHHGHSHGGSRGFLATPERRGAALFLSICCTWLLITIYLLSDDSKVRSLIFSPRAAWRLDVLVAHRGDLELLDAGAVGRFLDQNARIKHGIVLQPMITANPDSVWGKLHLAGGPSALVGSSPCVSLAAGLKVCTCSRTVAASTTKETVAQWLGEGTESQPLAFVLVNCAAGQSDEWELGASARVLASVDLGYAATGLSVNSGRTFVQFLPPADGVGVLSLCQIPVRPRRQIAWYACDVATHWLLDD